MPPKAVFWESTFIWKLRVFREAGDTAALKKKETLAQEAGRGGIPACVSG
jgi:hypothetical protein